MSRGIMKAFLEHPILMRKEGLFRKEFEEALSSDMGEAHYLEALRYACWEKDIHKAKKHMFKAVNKKEEAMFGMVMLTICSGEKELGEFFTEQLLNQPWATVLHMGDEILQSVERMGVRNGDAYAETWDVSVPNCAECHDISSRCEECFVYWCATEFGRCC